MKTAHYLNLLVLSILFFGGCKKKEEIAALPATYITQVIGQSGTLKDEKFNETYYLNLNRARLANLGKNPNDSTYLSQFDGSGKVEVAVWVSRSSYNYQNHAACKVDEGYVCIGGGAYADYGSGSTALLTESRPLNSNLETWVASSTDHLSPSLHVLSVYAIGLKLKGISANDLRKYISVQTATSAVGQYPNATAKVPKGYLLISGGARDSYKGMGNLLQMSRPITDSTWQAVGKDQREVDGTASMETYAIGIASTIPGFGALETQTKAVAFYVAKGKGIVNMEVESGWVLSGIGAFTDHMTGDRLLVGMSPSEINPRNIAAVSKDHLGDDEGDLQLKVVHFRKKPAIVVQ